MSDFPYTGEIFVAEDGTRSTVLEDTADPDYEPSHKEVEGYAKWLGIDLDKERDLLWIAREGLRTPLPKEWKACKTDTGEMYYFNFESGDSIWDHPLDDVFKDKVEEERKALASGKRNSAGILKKGSVAANALIHLQKELDEALQKVAAVSSQLQDELSEALQQNAALSSQLQQEKQKSSYLENELQKLKEQKLFFE